MGQQSVPISLSTEMIEPGRSQLGTVTRFWERLQVFRDALMIATMTAQPLLLQQIVERVIFEAGTEGLEPDAVAESGGLFRFEEAFANGG